MQTEVWKVRNEWQTLIFEAREKYVFGKRINQKLFSQCMKSAFEVFLLNQDTSQHKQVFSWEEADLLSKIYAYSCLPAIVESSYSQRFEASTHAAGILAQAIMHPETMEIDGYRLIDDGFLVKGEFKTIVYDFNKGDLKDILGLVQMGYWN